MSKKKYISFKSKFFLIILQVEEYHNMKLQWKTMSAAQEKNFSAFRERKIQIEKDVLRTDRSFDHYSGQDNKNLKVLNDILMTYVMYNFDLGYVQVR